MKLAWSDTRRLLEEALALPPAEREAWVRASAEEGALADEVLALLAADATEDPLLDGAPPLAMGDGAQDEATLPPESVVAGYRVRELLGTGGTATVYRATSPAGRLVALKLLHPALGAAAGARFLAERDVLEALDHEGIVLVLDAGVHAGRPYLVTELVDGLPLDRFARERLPGRRERLALFLRLAEAVHHAHARLVVHRDLKPGNVLVTADGSPKVLDFGVAKLLGDSAALTLPGARAPLTLAYASPEQRRGGPVTTATDVWALGVLLRELVTGRAPTPAGEPVGPAPGGDLGAVIACATALEPERRYAGARQLADDVRNVLARRPITARRASLADAAWKWTRRNPLPAALAAAGALALVIGTAVALVSARRARASESVAWGAHANAVWATNTWAGLLERLAAGGASERAEVAALLPEVEARIAADAGRRPEAEARLRNGLARVALALGELAPAEEHARRALALSRGTRGLGPADVRANLRVLAEIQLERGDPAARATAAELAAACSGRPDEEREARALSARIDARFPERP